jgi:acyl-homoserine lactone acylase PvdQ
MHYSQSYAYFNRFTRVSELIEKKLHIEGKPFEVSDTIEILSDVYDIYAANIIPKLISIVERNLHLFDEGTGKEKLMNYISMLKSFDYHMTKNSTAATLYSVLEYHLGKNLLLKNPENNVNKGFSNEIEARAVLNVFNYWNFIYDLVEKVELNKEDTPDLENCRYYKPFSNCEGYILNTFEKLEIFLQEGGYIKENGEIKAWGEVHFHVYPHTFDGANPILKKIFSRKISTEGNRYTVKVSKNKFHDLLNGPFTSVHSATMKFVVDLADITRPYIALTTGNSGNVLTKFYDNLLEKSENNELIKIKHHEFNDDVHLLISFPEHNTLIIRNK